MSNSSGQLHKLSCKNCRTRKIKCPRTHPCAHCQRSGLECVFPKPARRPGAKSPNAEITQRLGRLEKLIGKLGQAQVDQLESEAAVDVQTPTSSKSVSVGNGQGINDVVRRTESLDFQEQQPILKADGSRYLSGDFWANLSGEVDGLRQALNQESEDEEEVSEHTPSSQGLASEGYSPDPQLIFGRGTYSSDLRSFHPHGAHVTALANTFFTRVDPLFKVLHRPTMLVVVQAAAYGQRDLSNKNHEALLLAIYFAAVTALSNEDCMAMFRQDRQSLVMQYKNGIEAALTNADLLNTTELSILQAFCIYVLCMRTHTDKRSVWVLLCVVVRIAQALELNCDPEGLSMSVFEAEMRRRLWWQIIVLDIMHVEDRGTHPLISRQIYDTKLPMNINDEDLCPTKEHFKVEGVGTSEMTCSLVGFEAARCMQEVFALSPRRRDKTPQLHEYEQVVRECCNRLQESTVNCDRSVPIEWAAISVSRMCMLRLWLLLQYPLNTRRQVIKVRAARENILGSAVSLVEISQMLEQSPQGLIWAWMGKNWVVWYPIAVVLAELCHQTRGPLVERAWCMVELVYESLSKIVADSRKGALWRPISKLLEKARSARAQDTSPKMVGWNFPNASLIAAEPGSSDWFWLHDESRAMALGKRNPCESAFVTKEPLAMQQEIVTPPIYLDTDFANVQDSTDWENWDSFIQGTWNIEEQQVHQENGGMLW